MGRLVDADLEEARHRPPVGLALIYQPALPEIVLVSEANALGLEPWVERGGQTDGAADAVAIPSRQAKLLRCKSVEEFRQVAQPLAAAGEVCGCFTRSPVLHGSPQSCQISNETPASTDLLTVKPTAFPV
jgi:hypothetical protein